MDCSTSLVVMSSLVSMWLCGEVAVDGLGR